MDYDDNSHSSGVSVWFERALVLDAPGMLERFPQVTL